MAFDEQVGKSQLGRALLGLAASNNLALQVTLRNLQKSMEELLTWAIHKTVYAQDVVLESPLFAVYCGKKKTLLKIAVLGLVAMQPFSGCWNLSVGG